MAAAAATEATALLAALTTDATLPWASARFPIAPRPFSPPWHVTETACLRVRAFTHERRQGREGEERVKAIILCQLYLCLPDCRQGPLAL